MGRSTAVFRIFQEILSNVATHAKATRVTVRLAMLGRSLLLIVEDNGCGIPREAIEASLSLGLIGMRERASLLDGDAIVRPVDPHGTVVTVTIPLDERRHSARESG